MSTFKTLNKDNTEVEIVIAGARAQSSNYDISSATFANYDNDTSNTYRLAEIAVKDAFGNASSNGFGNLFFRTNGTGVLGSNISDRMVILWNGNIGISNMNPQYKLDVEGVMRVSSNILVGSNTIDQVIDDKVATLSGGNAAPMLLQTTSSLIIKEPSAFRTISSYIMKHTPSNVIISAKSVESEYNVRAYNVNMRQVLGAKTFSNVSMEVQNVPLSNMGSTVNHTIEVQVQGSNLVVGGYSIG